MIKHRVKMTLEIERLPKRCNECPMFHLEPYRCHNEAGEEGFCHLGYFKDSDMRDFYGNWRWPSCKMENDKRVKIRNFGGKKSGKKAHDHAGSQSNSDDCD